MINERYDLTPITKNLSYVLQIVYLARPRTPRAPNHHVPTPASFATVSSVGSSSVSFSTDVSTIDFALRPIRTATYCESRRKRY